MKEYLVVVQHDDGRALCAVAGQHDIDAARARGGARSAAETKLGVGV